MASPTPHYGEFFFFFFPGCFLSLFGAESGLGICRGQKANNFNFIPIDRAENCLVGEVRIDFERDCREDKRTEWQGEKLKVSWCQFEASLGTLGM